MWKILVPGIAFLCMISTSTPRTIEIVDSSEELGTQKPVDIPIRIGPRRSSSGTLYFFKPADDAFLHFVDKLMNVSYASSQATLNKIREHTTRIKDIGGQVEEFVENLPSFPIPLLDDVSSHAKLLN